MKENAQKQKTKTKRSNWKQSPETVKSNILKVATEEMANNGLAGSRINVIAEQSDTSKRMIYYYFGDKEGLYQAVLESAYESIRKKEQELNLDHLSPVEALEELVEFTILHHNNNPDFIRLIMVENIHKAKYLKLSKKIRGLNSSAIDRIDNIYKRGVESGDFIEGLKPIEIHWYISAFSFFNIANRNTFSVAFDYDSGLQSNKDSLVKNIKSMILQYISKK